LRQTTAGEEGRRRRGGWKEEGLVIRRLLCDFWKRGRAALDCGWEVAACGEVTERTRKK
jgi:hypothetical protein